MRVALCLSGQMRTYRDCAGPLIENIIKPLNADVFIHTWRHTGLSTKLLLYVPHDLHPIMPKGLDRDVVDMTGSEEKSQFEQVFPSLYNLVKSSAQANQTVEAKELTELYGARKCVVDDYDKSAISRGFDLEIIARSIGSLGLNTLPMFFKIWACDNLRRDAEREYGAPYDVVIRLRPDYMVLGQLPEELLQCPGGLTTLHNPFYEAAGLSEVAFDAFAIGTSEAMTSYAAVWEHLSDYFDPNQYPDWPMTKRGAEAILYRHLASIGAQKNLFKPNFLMYRKLDFLDYRIVIDSIRQDIGTLPEFRDFMQKLQEFEAQKFGLKPEDPGSVSPT